MDKGDVIRSRILRVCLFLETECPCSLRLVYLLPSLWTEYFTMPANMPNHKLNPGKKNPFGRCTTGCSMTQLTSLFEKIKEDFLTSEEKIL